MISQCSFSYIMYPAEILCNSLTEACVVIEFTHLQLKSYIITRPNILACFKIIDTNGMHIGTMLDSQVWYEHLSYSSSHVNWGIFKYKIYCLSYLPFIKGIRTAFKDMWEFLYSKTNLTAYYKKLRIS